MLMEITRGLSGTHTQKQVQFSPVIAPTQIQTTVLRRHSSPWPCAVLLDVFVLQVSFGGRDNLT